MNLIRFLILIYIIIVPVLLVASIYLSVRTRNIIRSNFWLKKYFLPSFFLLMIFFLNFGLIYKLYPSVVSKHNITCVSNNDFAYDIKYPMNQSYIGLIEIERLDYIEHANVFNPSIVGYTNTLFYQFNVIESYQGTINQGLLNITEHQPAFLMDRNPCATLDYQERLSEGVYIVYMDERPQSLPYIDQWYDEAWTLFSYEVINDYDVGKSYDMQDQSVKDDIDVFLSILNSE